MKCERGHVGTGSIFREDVMCWRSLSKNENVWSLFSLAPGG